MIKKYYLDILNFFLIALTVFLFFAKLFWPTPQLLVTPDFGRSDAWHFSFATKYFLSESLKKNQLPLWSGSLGGGFPLMAEGQIGTFFLPNLLLFRFFDPVTAYNTALVLTLVFLGWGTYALLRTLKLSSVTALFSGLTMSFSGIAIVQLPHLALLQGMTLLPAILTATLLLTHKKSFLTLLILALLLNQQILAGFPQATFITVLMSFFLFLFMIRKEKSGLSGLGSFILTFLLALGLSAIQILPSWEFLQYSADPSGFSGQDASYFSYPVKHLATLLDPFVLGNPKFGTYPPFNQFRGSIFWENTGFVGILPLIAAVLAVILAKKNKPAVGFFAIVLGISFLLMLGNNSPLYLIYSFWPFNLFRVPSRFIWIFDLSLVTLAAYGLEIILSFLSRFKTARVLFIIFLGINLFYLVKPWTGYHQLEPAGTWLTLPESGRWFTQDDRLLTLGGEAEFNQFFLKTGWTQSLPYVYLRNFLAPDSNLVWHIGNAEVYAGRSLQRQAIFNGLLSAQIKENHPEATVSALAIKFMNLASIDSVITALSLHSDGLKPQNILKNNFGDIKRFTNTGSLPAAYIATKVSFATTAEGSARILSDENFVAGRNVLLSEAISLPAYRPEFPPTVKITRPSETETVVDVNGNGNPAILVLNDTFYPGWQAELDGKKVAIYPANITFRGVQIPPGNHRVIFRFQPLSFMIGASISMLTALILLSAAAFLLSGAFFRTRQKTL